MQRKGEEFAKKAGVVFLPKQFVERLNEKASVAESRILESLRCNVSSNPRLHHLHLMQIVLFDCFSREKQLLEVFWGISCGSNDPGLVIRRSCDPFRMIGQMFIGIDDESVHRCGQWENAGVCEQPRKGHFTVKPSLLPRQYNPVNRAHERWDHMVHPDGKRSILGWGDPETVKRIPPVRRVGRFSDRAEQSLNDGIEGVLRWVVSQRPGGHFRPARHAV